MAVVGQLLQNTVIWLLPRIWNIQVRIYRRRPAIMQIIRDILQFSQTHGCWDNTLK
jgi:hypothetical protein